MTITIPSRLSDMELLAAVSRCARDEHGATTQLVAHLAELDLRRLYLGAGYSSLFVYCREVLRLHEHATYNRIEAARAARRFPVILQRLADGMLNLTTVRMLARHLTDENHEELLAAAARCNKQEVEELLARRYPRPDTPSSVRKVPERNAALPVRTIVAPEAPIVDSESAAASTGPAESPLVLLPTDASALTAPRRPVIAPLATDRDEIRFTASAATRDKLKVAQDLLSHSVPGGDVAQVIDRALTSLIDELSRTKLAIVRKPVRKPGRTAVGSRHIPSNVKRAVWKRDSGRCAFVASNGHRCAERAFLEYHHVTPYAVGGQATVPNIQLRCRAHNGHEADLFYGWARSNGGEGRVNESRAKYAVSWGFRLVPERVGFDPRREGDRAVSAAAISCRGGRSGG